MDKKFVRRVNQEIHDIHDQPFLLKGVGLGGWLLMEGYMLKSTKDINRPRHFKAHFTKMTNEAYVTSFYNKWYHEFISESDIILIKNKGFNSIRVAIDYQFLFVASETKVELEPIHKHFEIIDDLLSVCNAHEVYMILDMHAAPGGQTGANIDNSENDHPDLFTNELYQEQLCYIWKVIADRYKDESMVAAYDLLNEPLPKIFSQYNDQLMPLYKRIIQSIREVDKNHMITVEGLHWATDFSCFNEVLDDNIMLHFHKYWSNPDQAGIQAFLDKREVLNVPIFMGEGGENSLAWYYAAFKLYEQHNISTNFWAYKKMETNNSIISFKKPDHWEEFLEGALNEKESISVLDQLIEYISFDQTIVREDCINHVLGKNTLHIPAYGFDYVGKDQVFHVNKKHKTSLRKNDGISVTDLKGNVIEPNFWNRNEQSALQVNLEKGEWVSYTFDLDADIKAFTISLEGSSSTYMLYLNDQKIHADTVYEPSSFKGNKYWLKVVADKDTHFEWIHINCES